MKTSTDKRKLSIHIKKQGKTKLAHTLIIIDVLSTLYPP